MIAWLQNVYENARSRPATIPLAIDPASVAARKTTSPTAAAAQIAENRFSARAGSHDAFG